MDFATVIAAFCGLVTVLLAAFMSTNTYLRLRCWWRLRFGFCPHCYSSPPNPDCFVCEGSRQYGPACNDLTKARWRAIYLSWL